MPYLFEFVVRVVDEALFVYMFAAVKFIYMLLRLSGRARMLVCVCVCVRLCMFFSEILCTYVPYDLCVHVWMYVYLPV